MRLAHHPAAQRFGQRLGHLGKNALGWILDRILPVPPNCAPETLPAVRRVLLVRPNFRIGNTLMTTPLVLALRRRFPQAQLDYLAGDSTAVLLRGLPIDRVYCVSRRSIARPWQFLALFWRLRRVGYDVAVEAGLGSFSGALYAYLCGARYRIGCSGRGDRFLNVRLPPFPVAHVYDSPVAFARLLGSDCPDAPVYQVLDDEKAVARRILAGLGLMRGEVAAPFAAVFIGGHQDKRWPAEQWLELGRELVAAGGRLLMFLGPEELGLEERLRRELPAAVRLLRPQPLRTFAAILAESRLVITPDSGPMHLAAALGVPMIALLQTQQSQLYRPRREHDRALMGPTVAQAVAAVTAHPSWEGLADTGRKENGEWRTGDGELRTGQ